MTAKETSEKRTSQQEQKEPANFEEYYERHCERIGLRFVEILDEVTSLLNDWCEAEEPDDLDAATRAISAKKANRIIANGIRDFEEWYAETLPDLLKFLCGEESVDMPEYEPDIPKGWLGGALRESSEELVTQVSGIHDAAKEVAAILRKNSGASWVSDVFENFYSGFTNPIEGVRRMLKTFSGDSPEQKEAEKADARLQDALEAYDEASEGFYNAAIDAAVEQLPADIAAFAEFVDGEDENDSDYGSAAQSGATAVASSDTIEWRLAKLKSLFEKGLISQSDFDEKKEQILSEI